ncbi:MAG TPA: hypothetical protein VKT27_01085 [Candidatus Binataceae bacterium]|nr:hypothetical protein [Candidatus Binataceae bacterium]
MRPSGRALSANDLLLCAIGAGLVLAAFFPALVYSVDGNSMIAVAESLATGHGFSVASAGLGAPGRCGLYYSKWYPLLSVLAAPPAALGVLVSRRLGLPQHYVAAVFAVTLSPIIAAATVLLVAMVARRLGASKRGALLAALAFGFGTIAMTYSREFFADPLLALITIAGIYFALNDSVGAAALSAALAVLAKPTGIVLGPCLGGYLLCRRLSALRWLAPFGGTAAGLLIYLAYNWSRFGNPLDFGQRGDFALNVVFPAMTGLLVSPGSGLLWYCPAVIAIAWLPAMTFKRLDTALIVAVALAYLAEHSLWIFWVGGWSWGPRLLLPALPGLVALTGLLERRMRWLLVVLTVAGFVINAPTLMCFYERYDQEAAAARISTQAQTWDPRHAQLFRIWGAALRETEDAWREADQVGAFVRQAGSEPVARTVAGSRALRIVNLWWWMLPAVGVPRIAGAAVSLALLIAGVWLIARALARARDDDFLCPHNVPLPR